MIAPGVMRRVGRSDPRQGSAEGRVDGSGEATLQSSHVRHQLGCVCFSQDCFGVDKDTIMKNIPNSVVEYFFGRTVTMLSQQ